MEQRQQFPKRRGRVTESLDEFLKSLKKKCNSTIDPSPRKRGRPSESLKTYDKLKCYSEPFSKRGRPAINLILPGYITNHQTMKESQKGKVLEASQEKSSSPKIVKKQEEIKQEEEKNLGEKMTN